MTVVSKKLTGRRQRPLWFTLFNSTFYADVFGAYIDLSNDNVPKVVNLLLVICMIDHFYVKSDKQVNERCAVFQGSLLWGLLLEHRSSNDLISHCVLSGVLIANIIEVMSRVVIGERKAAHSLVFICINFLIVKDIYSNLSMN